MANQVCDHVHHESKIISLFFAIRIPVNTNKSERFAWLQIIRAVLFEILTTSESCMIIDQLEDSDDDEELLNASMYWLVIVAMISM